MKGKNAHGRTVWECLIKSAKVSNWINNIYEDLKEYDFINSEKLWQDFTDFARRAGKTITNTAKEWMRNTKDMIELLKKMIGWKLDNISDTAKRFYDDLKDRMKRLRDQISDEYDNFEKFVRNIWDKLKGRAKNLFDGFLDWVRFFDPVSFFLFVNYLLVLFHKFIKEKLMQI